MLLHYACCQSGALLCFALRLQGILLHHPAALDCCRALAAHSHAYTVQLLLQLPKPR